MQKRWKTNLSSTSENAFTIHGFWVQLSKKDLKPFSIIAQSPHTLLMFLRKPATILWTRTASTEVHTCSHKENSSHSRISFFLLDEEFRGTASLVCWKPFFIVVIKLRRVSQKKLKYLASFWAARTPFWAAFAGLARWAQVGYFPFAESGKLPRWAIEATGLGCEPRLRGRKFPDDSPRQLTGNPPRAAHHSPRSATKWSPLFTNKPYWDTSFCQWFTNNPYISENNSAQTLVQGLFSDLDSGSGRSTNVLYYFACVPYLPR